MKNLLLLPLLLVSGLIMGQTIENGSFENWELAGSNSNINEPVDWSSIQPELRQR